jgi:hypothetical protein
MTWLDEPWKEWSNSHWTKHEWLCTECDTLMEFTTYWKDELVPIPACPCPHQAIIKLNTHVLESSSNVSYHSDVTSITPTPLVKINSNPYN